MERTRILVWDLPLRVFHWLLALSFAGAFLTAEAERFRDVHVVLGYTFLGLLAFRLVWGVAGSRYARFRSFLYGPRAVITYLQSLVARRPIHYVGHNPAGSWAIYAILYPGLRRGGERLRRPHRRRRPVARIAARRGFQRSARAGGHSRRGCDRRQFRASRESGRRDADRLQVRVAVRGDPRNSLGHGGGADCSCCRLLDRGCRDRGWIRAGRQGDDGRRASPIPSFAPWWE